MSSERCAIKVSGLLKPRTLTGIAPCCRMGSDDIAGRRVRALARRACGIVETSGSNLRVDVLAAGARVSAARRNLPNRGEVTLDHVGHFVADADAATKVLVAAGFTVTPYSAQVAPDPVTGEPALTGTANVCVMLRLGYLEVLTHTADTPIGLEFREALARRAGLHLAAFAVADAAETHAALAAAGWPMRPLARFLRNVDTGAGSEEARFTVARLAKGTMPEGRVQVLTHHNEAAMWQARWTDHENTAEGLAATIVAAPDPEEAAGRFANLLGRSATPCANGFRVALDRGAVEVVDEAEGARLVGCAVEAGRPAFVGTRISVGDPERALWWLERGGLKPRREGDAIVTPFPAALGIGAWIMSAA